MSRNDSTGRGRRTAFGLATAAGGALAAVMLSMGTAHADITTPYIDPYTPPDPYDVLFGAMGQQGIDNALLDSNLATSNPTGDLTFMTDVSQFEASTDHPLADLINSIDPSAFYEQTGGLDPSFAGDLAGGAYLAPDDTLGYLATGLDYGLLTPTGLAFVLDPLINLLLGGSG
ncbi:MAG: hypothetical protein JOY55_13595 [Mycobacterium sp.]|nr:hypothetical protein [Mycobacterium sp.]MBV8292818.1 hypothetical protein [Mycobacterium sp.]